MAASRSTSRCAELSPADRADDHAWPSDHRAPRSVGARRHRAPRSVGARRPQLAATVPLADTRAERGQPTCTDGDDAGSSVAWREWIIPDVLTRTVVPMSFQSAQQKCSGVVGRRVEEALIMMLRWWRPARCWWYSGLRPPAMSCRSWSSLTCSPPKLQSCLSRRSGWARRSRWRQHQGRWLLRHRE